MAEADKKPDQGAEERAAPAKKAGGGSNVVAILLVVNSVLTAGVLAFVLLRPQGLARHESAQAAAAEDHPAAKADAKDHGKEAAGGKDKDGRPLPPGPTLRLPDFVIHLRDTDTDRYARISFEVEVDDDKAKEDVNARMPLIRDAFLTYLSDRTAEDLRGSDGIARVKAALAQKLSDAAAGVRVRALYVTELVVQ